MAKSLDQMFTIMQLMGNDTSTEASTSNSDDVPLYDADPADVNATLLSTEPPANRPNLQIDWIPPQVQEFWERFMGISGHEWIIFGMIAVVVALLLALAAGICCWIYKHKKRVIQPPDEPIVADYEDGLGWGRCLPCCRGRKSSGNWERQNSSSNLAPYRRPPLPPIVGEDPNKDGYTGSYLPAANRLPPIQPRLVHIDPDDPRMGANISGIRDVPNTPAPPGPHRPLPLLEKF
ncbi:unnamed protein product, partial [Mesorhabditis spiculigera]